MKQSKFFFFIIGVLLLCSNIFAQGFEGTISMEVNAPMMGEKKIPMTISTKGEKSLIHIETPQGPMDMYTNRSTEKMTMVMLSRKMGFTMSMKSDDKAKKKKEETKVTATGEKKTINGYNCELYTVTSEKNTSNMWLTTDLPKSLILAFKDAFETQSRQSGRPMSPAVEALFKKGLMPVQVETLKDGKVQGTVTFLSYSEKKLDDSMFAIPSDIKVMDMGAMGGMGGNKE